MRAIIIVRHGLYGNDGHLTPAGQSNTLALGERLKEIIAPWEKVVLLSSSALRAQDGAVILGWMLSVEPEMDEALWSDRDHRENRQRAAELIRSKEDGADVIVVVTHLEYASRLIPEYSKTFWGASVWGPRLEKGEAFVLDCEAKTTAKV